MKFIDFFILSQSHHTKFTYLKYVIYIHFFYLFSTLNVFSSLHDKNFETDEKNYCIFDESITL